MPRESPIDVHYVASLARLSLTPEEESAFSTQLERVLDYVAQLEAVDVSSLNSGIQGDGPTDFTRPDAARPSQSQEDALRNAPRRSGDQFLVPKVVE